MMMTLTEYVLFWSIMFCLIGVVSYLLDFRFGGGLRTSWYNMTHRDQLPDEEIRGLIYRQNFSTRLQSAVLIGVMGSLIVVYETRRPMAILFLWIIAIVSVFLGFKLGPIVERLWRGRQKAIHALERIETDGIDVKKGTQVAVHYVQARVSDVLHHGHHPSPVITPDPVVEKPSSPPPEKSDEEPEKVDPRDLIKKFINRSG